MVPTKTETINDKKHDHTSLAPGSRYSLSSIITDSSTKNDTTKSCGTGAKRVNEKTTFSWYAQTWLSAMLGNLKSRSHWDCKKTAWESEEQVTLGLQEKWCYKNRRQRPSWPTCAHCVIFYKTASTPIVADVRPLRDTLKSSAPIVTSCSVIPTTTSRGATIRCSRKSPSSTRSINICENVRHHQILQNCQRSFAAWGSASVGLRTRKFRLPILRGRPSRKQCKPPPRPPSVYATSVYSPTTGNKSAHAALEFSAISSVQLVFVLGAFFGHRNTVSAGKHFFDAWETPFPTHSIFYRPVFRLLQWLFAVEPNNEPIHVRGGCAGDGRYGQKNGETLRPFDWLGSHVFYAYRLCWHSSH